MRYREIPKEFEPVVRQAIFNWLSTWDAEDSALREPESREAILAELTDLPDPVYPRIELRWSARAGGDARRHGW